jgi:2-haloalkanoic acid dehalogenase type II
MGWTLCAFDLYGTLLDVTGLGARLVPFAGESAPVLLARWRKRQLERTWELNARGAYQPFDVVTAQALEEVAPHLDAGVREQMCATWLALPAFADAARSLERLRTKGVKRAVLSNGTLPMIRSAVGAAEGAKRFGLQTTWIDRGGTAPGVPPDLRVHSLAELADEAC